jgi:hypothetical protein
MRTGMVRRGSHPINIYLVKIDGLRGSAHGAIVAESEEDACNWLMAELKERMLPQSGPRVEEIRRMLATGPVDLGVPAVHLLDRQDW